MGISVVIDGNRTTASGRIIRQYRKFRGLSQEELGRRMNVKKARISKIENSAELDADVLVNTLKHLDVEAQIFASSTTTIKLDDMFTFIIDCVSAFAKSKSLTKKAAFNYLNIHNGINLLSNCYDVEVTLPLNEIINDLTLVCQRNGGSIR